MTSDAIKISTVPPRSIKFSSLFILIEATIILEGMTVAYDETVIAHLSTS